MENPLKDLHNYSSEMSISQVVKFFQRQGMSFTKTMIQNYVRIGALKPPVDKRVYRAEHLKTLVLLDSLKSVYSLEEIKGIFALVPPEELYDKYLEMNDSAIEFWDARKHAAASREDLLLELSAHCAAAKLLTQRLLESV